VTIPAGYRITLVFSGDVSVEANILRELGPYSDSSDIPALAIVSLSNADSAIRIHPSVDNLFGVYYTNGTINTCAVFDNSANPNIRNLSGVDGCNTPLRVNGMLSADGYQFRRTKTDPDGNTGGIEYAEIIDYIPELYLSRPPLLKQLSEPNQPTQVQLKNERPPLL